MPKQHSLTGPQALISAPYTGVSEPRLWVRRLVIWKEPGEEKLRDIILAPGLNIIWSPDRAEHAEPNSQAAIGHGRGKTLFCRLIRYCLGEDRFSTEAQRERIGTAFINGIVGAEVILDGTPWAIVRPLGIRRRHIAVQNENLDEIARADGPSGGFHEFVETIDRTILTSALADLVRPGAGGPIWPIALAWLAREPRVSLR